MYESPIHYSQHIAEECCKEVDNGLLRQIKVVVGYDIDREELIKALNYDRGQYEKGLADAVKHGRWEELYESNYKCSVCGSWWTCEETPIESGMSYCPNCGSRMDLDEVEE